MDIYANQYAALTECIAKCGISASEIAAVGITNQRETVIIWDKNTGNPVYNAIVWQCRRTADECEALEAAGHGDYIRKTTGLRIDPYFSGTKIKWILDNVEGARERAKRGELLAGTVDTWLIWKLTGGKVFVTDRTNASRTMLYDINRCDWDDELLSMLGVPRQMLPKVVDTAQVVGYLKEDILGANIPIAALAGDQHAALFGQACFEKGMVKNTYGTGCFMLMNIGDQFKLSQNGLITTLAWRLNGKPTFAFEGSVFVAGAAIQWLRDEMKLIETAAESEQVALSVPDSGGVYLVPAFTGMGAPYWDMYTRGTLVGMTRGTGRAHIVRAALESIAFQSRDLFHAMAQDGGMESPALRVDGGASANQFLMQLQSDLIGLPVVRPKVLETTALGAALLVLLPLSVLAAALFILYPRRYR